jgi:hypothetical protein
MMTDDTPAQASSQTPQRNPALKALEVLVGEWRVEMALPVGGAASVHTSMSFMWLEEGAFLMQLGDRTSNLPWSTSIISRDEGVETYSLLYYDWRGTSRIYAMSLSDGVWKQWRTAPGFSQRFSGELSDDRQTITARWEKSSDGSTWENDFDLTYTKVR